MLRVGLLLLFVLCSTWGVHAAVCQHMAFKLLCAPAALTQTVIAHRLATSIPVACRQWHGNRLWSSSTSSTASTWTNRCVPRDVLHAHDVQHSSIATWPCVGLSPCSSCRACLAQCSA